MQFYQQFRAHILQTRGIISKLNTPFVISAWLVESEGPKATHLTGKLNI
jgi:hypothetical protein